MPEHVRDPAGNGHHGPAPAGPALGVAAVARRLGVAAGTLRTWDRRYGLGPSEHTAGARRRYTPDDLARLEVMRRLLLDGVSAGEAARVALADGGNPDGDHSAWSAAPPRTRRATARGGRSRPGGGRVVPLRDASPEARGLARAAMSLDGDACTHALATALRRRGVVATWTDLLLPVLAGLGERWQTTGEGVEVEHLLTESAETALRSTIRTARPPGPGRPVLLAGLEAEDHRLPIVALAAALRERAVPTRLLGVRLPLRGLAEAVTRTGPAAVFLWSQGVHGPGGVPGPEVLQAVRPRPVLVLGGPGYVGQRGRADARWVAGLAEAVDVLAER